MPDRIDVVIVGGGIVGLATARALLEARPSLELVVLEKEERVGTHQTGHNSGVLHSGLYYRPGSLKARLCVEGRRRMVEYCKERDVPIQLDGKVVVATDAGEVPLLEDLFDRGTANGVEGLDRLGSDGILDHEPAATGVAALWVASTGVVDFSAVAEAVGKDLLRAGGRVITGATVDRIELRDGGITVGAGEHTIGARLLVNAAGLHADRVAALSGVEPPARLVPFRGEYFVLKEEAAPNVRSLIYPVPDPRFPFLGVHFTRRVDGAVEVGPNAVLALGREHYRGSKADWSEVRSILGYGGFRKLARRFWRTGAAEMIASASKILYARRARRLVPSVRATDLDRGGSGVRAQAVFPDGTMADDFVIAGEGPLLHVLSAPSPAATAALAIGDHLAGMALERIGAA